MQSVIKSHYKRIQTDTNGLATNWNKVLLQTDTNGNKTDVHLEVPV